MLVDDCLRRRLPFQGRQRIARWCRRVPCTSVSANASARQMPKITPDSHATHYGGFRAVRSYFTSNAKTRSAPLVCSSLWTVPRFTNVTCGFSSVKATITASRAWRCGGPEGPGAGASSHIVTRSLSRSCLPEITGKCRRARARVGGAEGLRLLELQEHTAERLVARAFLAVRNPSRQDKGIPRDGPRWRSHALLRHDDAIPAGVVHARVVVDVPMHGIGLLQPRDIPDHQTVVLHYFRGAGARIRRRIRLRLRKKQEGESQCSH